MTDTAQSPDAGQGFDFTADRYSNAGEAVSKLAAIQELYERPARRIDISFEASGECVYRVLYVGEDDWESGVIIDPPQA
jgi:hypothetical protein